MNNWAHKLCIEFEESIESTTNLVDNRSIESLVNNYTFMVAASGNIEKSRLLLDSVIKKWQKEYLRSNDKGYLEKTLQPGINLIRLSLLIGDFDNFWQQIENATFVGVEDSICISNTYISVRSINQHKNFIRNNTIKECIKGLIKQGRYDELLALETSMPEELVRSLFYREAQVVSHISRNSHQKAIAIIRGVMSKTIDVEQLIFYFRLYESYRLQGKKSEAEVVLDEIIDELLILPIDNLKHLMFASMVVKAKKLDISHPLVQTILVQYEQIGDEMNYGFLLLWLYGLTPNSWLRSKLKELHCNTQYFLLRKELDRLFDCEEKMPAGKWFLSLEATFGEIFD
ncbi:MAG: hypothetical protein HWE27_16195 [Gammaproteobacteria bacterium]|nr:hypothetical protein [Gammaproteobacteria bacterium]